MQIARSAVLPFMAIIVATAIMSLFAAASTSADELSDLKHKLDIVAPAKAKALLAEGRAREDRVRSFLPKLREAEEKYIKARQRQINMEQRLKRLWKEAEKKEKSFKEQRRRIMAKAEAESKRVFRDKTLDEKEQRKEYNRLLDLHRQTLLPELDSIKALEKKGIALQTEMMKRGYELSDSERDYLGLREKAGLSIWERHPPIHVWATRLHDIIEALQHPDTQINLPEYPSPKPVSKELDDIVKRNKRLETLVKIGHLLAGEEGTPKEPEPKTAEKPQQAPPATQSNKGPDQTKSEAGKKEAAKKETAKTEAAKKSEPKAGGGQKPQQQASKEPAPKSDDLARNVSKATGREAEANEDIADARRYYHEGRAFDTELHPSKAADSYRVALSLLAQARARTESPARAAKIDTAIDNVSKRLADLPKQPQKQKDTPAEAGQRQLGNRECASQFPGSVMVKPDSKGGFFCRCPSGHAWNNDRTACVKARSARARGQAACRKSFSHSVFVGFRNGLPRCRCPRGRVWNQSRTACVRAPKRRNVHRPDPRAAQAMYALGVLIGQAIRSSSGSRRQPHCHREPNGTIHCQ